MKHLVFMLALAIVITPSMVRPGVVNLQPVGDLTTWPDMPYRWLDIADFLYAAGYKEFFNYGQPYVALSFCDISSAFEGSLVASGLKPNFAYLYQGRAVDTDSLPYLVNFLNQLLCNIKGDVDLFPVADSFSYPNFCRCII